MFNRNHPIFDLQNWAPVTGSSIMFDDYIQNELLSESPEIALGTYVRDLKRNWVNLETGSRIFVELIGQPEKSEGEIEPAKYRFVKAVMLHADVKGIVSQVDISEYAMAHLGTVSRAKAQNSFTAVLESIGLT